MRPERLEFMGHAHDHLKPGSNRHEPRLFLVFPGDPMAVRGALKKAMNFLRGLDFSQEECGPVELVLAEALNNVIEHAYEGQVHGVIELSIEQQGEVLEFVILDDGLPMPGGNTPKGREHDLTCDVIDLPEGGFGWFLIHELTRDLVYIRTGNRNRLMFSIGPSVVNLQH